MRSVSITSAHIILVLSLFLTSCGGSDKNSGSSDQGSTSAPVATAPENPVYGASYDLVIVCNEAGEVVTITGKGLEPDSQIHTCKASGPEKFSLSLEQGVSFPSPNDLTISSKDQDENPKDKTTTVDVPINTLPWRVFIDGGSLEEISASNVQSFTVEGSCTEEGQPVIVSVGGLSPDTTPNCTNGSWSVSLNVRSLLNKTPISITADHSSSDGNNAAQALKKVINRFICPKNFVAVPPLTGYTTNNFCVMKYEAKNDGSGNAISQAASTPYVSINRNDSIAKCAAMGTAMGTKYDLITNDEWQSIARDIELVESNWGRGILGSSEGLSRGHSGPIPENALAANDDDNNACEGTGETCSGSTWYTQRRTHTLSNGEVIWDMAGNVNEWVKDDNTTSYGSNVHISQVTDLTHSTLGDLSGGTATTSRMAKGHFGPSGDYIGLGSGIFGGLGFGLLDGDSGNGVGGVIRGGSYDFSGGLFTVSVEATLSTTNVNLGFRCVYRP